MFSKMIQVIQINKYEYSVSNLKLSRRKIMNEVELQAAAFRRLLHHLGERTDVQNIDLMILAGFCRNCLSKWYLAEAFDEIEFPIH